MARLSAWVQASRPLSQLNIAVPLIYGQALAWAVHGTFQWELAGLVHLFGIFDQLFIVYANDAADFRSDAENRTFNRYSGGSRVVPMGLLTPFQLAVAAVLALLAMGGVSAVLALREQRAWMLVLTAMSAHLLWAYSFPPFRMSYRGYGEILQGLGVGLLLPVIGFYAQANTLEGIGASVLLPAFLLAVAGHLTTALPDTPSDRATSKRTFPVRTSERAARRASLLLVAAAALGSPLAVPGVGLAAGVAIVGVTALVLWRNVPLLATADAEQRTLCERFVTTNGIAINVVLVGWIVVLVAARG